MANAEFRQRGYYAHIWKRDAVDNLKIMLMKGTPEDRRIREKTKGRAQTNRDIG